MKSMMLILAAGVLLLAVAACNDESHPTITRMYASPTCGLAPLQVDFYGIASGGNETGPATGGNNNLEFTWSFGDGTTAPTSIGYHTYTAPGDYVLTLTVADPDGKSASRSLPVTVFADSLLIEAWSDATGPVTTTDTVRFNYRAASCQIDPDSETDRTSYLQQRWIMHDPALTGGGVYYGPEPAHSFSAPGTYDVELIATYTAAAVTRRDTVTIVVN